MFQYSWPGLQQVANVWNGTDDYYFKDVGTTRLCIVACVDGRGTAIKGLT